MFLGQYNHSIDNKGRLIIPSKYREEICEQKLVVAPWWEGDLVVFTADVFREYIRSLDETQGSPEKTRRIKRFITTGADECKLDGQGRILINQRLRDFAHLNGEVVITGNMESFEIWNPEIWAKTEEKIMDAEEMRNELESLKQML